MPVRPRPKGLPFRIPKWAWNALKLPARHLPHKKPAWFWAWRAWRLGEKKPVPPAPFKPLEGVDYEVGPSPAQLRAAGKRFVCRYLSTAGNPKNITASEARALHAAGLGIVLVFETTGSTFLGAGPAGRRDAILALNQVKALGVPASVPVYFSCDSDPSGHEAAIVSYIRAAAAVLGANRTGVYGGLNAVNACHQAGACAWFWQTLAWSGGVWSPANHLEQYTAPQTLAGHSVDFDRAVKPQFGAWLP